MSITLMAAEPIRVGDMVCLNSDGKAVRCGGDRLPVFVASRSYAENEVVRFKRGPDGLWHEVAEAENSSTEAADIDTTVGDHWSCDGGCGVGVCVGKGVVPRKPHELYDGTICGWFTIFDGPCAACLADLEREKNEL